VVAAAAAVVVVVGAEEVQGAEDAAAGAPPPGSRATTLALAASCRATKWNSVRIKIIEKRAIIFDNLIVLYSIILWKEKEKVGVNAFFLLNIQNYL
jgi:hypothetical protein